MQRLLSSDLDVGRATSLATIRGRHHEEFAISLDNALGRILLLLLLLVAESSLSLKCANPARACQATRCYTEISTTA